MNPLPNYLQIGYSKAASTWLQNILRKEKAIFFVYKTYFFYPLSSKNYNKGVEWYAKHFKDASSFKIIIESQEHIILPYIHPELKCASTSLKGVEKISKRIKDNLPDIKIIVTIRNQVDMLLSRYTQYVLQGGTLDASTFFSKLVFTSDCWLHYVDYRYAKIINILYDVFGKSNVLILFHEELKFSREEFLNDLSLFFEYEFSTSYQSEGKSANVAPSYWGVQLIRFLNKVFVKNIETLESKTQTRGPYLLWLVLNKIIRFIDNTLMRNKQKHKLLKEDELERIRQIFSEDNKDLAKMFNKPITEYGYF